MTRWRATAVAAVAAAVLAGGADGAGASTVARMVPDVGPVLAGRRVAWGIETRDGRLRVVRSGPREVALRVPRATAPDTRRTFFHTPWALAASGDAFGAVVLTGTTFFDPPDSSGTASEPAVIGGRWGSPAVLAGAITERGDGPCRPGHDYPVAVAVDGRRVAVAAFRTGCAPGDRPVYRVVVHDGAATTVVAAGGPVRALALAGRHVAWTFERGGLRIADVRTGRVERALRPSNVGHVEDVALTRAGAVAFTYARGIVTFGWNLGYLASIDAPLRRLARHVADRGVGLAGGRVLFERYRDRTYGRSDLLLRDVLSGATRRLAVFARGHRRAGDIDLGRDRATWAVRGERPRIVLRRL